MGSTIINWATASGDIGSYVSGQTLSFQLAATSTDPSSIIKYKIISGELPTGTIANPVTLSSFGLLLGELEVVNLRKSSSFTVRAFDQYGNIKDRTFSLVVVNNTTPKFTTLPGLLLTTVDSKYVSYQILYTNTKVDNEISITVSSGSLPPGLRVDSTGFISGYPEPPILFDTSPTTKTYTFSLQLSSPLGNDVSTYSIVVSNYQLDHPSRTRIPAIVNTKPMIYPIPTSDIYYDYYVTDGSIGTITANDYFSFKVVGYDFDGSSLGYNFYNLPTGLTGDTTTGWITGSVNMDAIGVNNYQFSASVYKLENHSIVSEPVTFYLTISHQLENDIKWITDSNLGTISNGSISELSIKATSSKEISYTLTQGQLPPNLMLAETGDLIGRVSFQPTTKMLAVGDTTTFTFTIVAYVVSYPLLKTEREFTITVEQQFANPSETIYIKASPSIENRKILKTLLADSNLIPNEYLYRPDDPYFGKATDIRFSHVFGAKPATLNTYITAVQTNHYVRRLFLGNLKLAIARDANSNIIYQVVYSEIIDDLVNPSGKSIPSVVNWPTTVNYNGNPINSVYPGSLDNMRKQVLSVVGHDSSFTLLPKWMNSQQLSGNTTGFVQGWVICYAKYEYAVESYDSNGDPIYYLNSDGSKMTYAERIKHNIETNWDYDLTSIEFMMDRYLVDKSATYDWNLNLQIPTWNELPSASPAPATLEDENMSILFPKKSII